MRNNFNSNIIRYTQLFQTMNGECYDNYYPNFLLKFTKIHNHTQILFWEHNFVRKTSVSKASHSQAMCANKLTV